MSERDRETAQLTDLISGSGVLDLLADGDHAITPADRVLIQLVIERLIRPRSVSATVQKDVQVERERCARLCDDVANGESRTPGEKAIAGMLAKRIREGRP